MNECIVAQFLLRHGVYSEDQRLYLKLGKKKFLCIVL